MRIIGIVAGKGGVGKSTVAVNLALAFKRMGFKVGLLDADVYGPSLGKMLKCSRLPAQSLENLERIIPAESLGVSLISMAFFAKEEEAAVVRAPIANGVIAQFLHQVEWGDLDYLFVDFPPGTGDIPLTLLQQGKFDGAVVVTTPQQVALLDVRKAVGMLRQLEIPLCGVVENMSHFLGHYPFGRGGGATLAKELGVPLLGEVPLDPMIGACAEEGESLFDRSAESEGAHAFFLVADELLSSLLGSQDKVTAAFLDEGNLKISWGDGWERIFPVAKIQSCCPCARCEHSRLLDPLVQGISVELVGRYGVKIQFSSGCSRGIYPFSVLRRMVE